jgi:hypothetical protein
MKKNILFYFSFIIIIYLSSFSWEFINLPYTESSIIGEYSKNRYNSYNDLLRYLIFVFIPIIVLLLYLLITKQFSISNILEKIAFKNQKKIPNVKNKSLYLLLIIFNFFLLLEFLSIEFPVQKVDFFHEGQQMSAAYKFRFDKSLWSGSYVTIGVIYEIIASNIAWNFFNNVSIGSTRFFDLVVIYLVKFFLVILSFQMANVTNLKGSLKNIYFVAISLISVNLLDYYFQAAKLDGREIFVILTLIIIIQFFIGKNESKYLIYLLGPISCISIFYSVDRGLVVNLLIIFFLFILAIKKKSICFGVLLSLILSWYFSVDFFGNEFSFFINNTLTTLSEINKIGGIIHPVPFSSDQNSARATKSIFLITLGLVISINHMNKKKNYQLNTFVFCLFLISVLSFLTYGYAVGRSDGGHIKSTFGYTIIFYSLFIIYYLLNVFSNYIKNFKYYDYALILLLSLVFFSKINFTNIFEYKNRLNEYVNLNDEYFLTSKQNKFLKNTQSIILNQECIQNLSNDVLLLYLLRKTNCTKFYFPITIGSDKNQNLLINQMKNVKIVLLDGVTNEFSPIFRLKLVKKFIEENYQKIYEEDAWILLEAK